MPEIQDDKAQYVVPFILERLEIHRTRYDKIPPACAPPFFIGLNGVQGAGKTVLVSILEKTLQAPPHNLPTVVFSLDDLYLSHDDQVKLAESHPDNPLLQHRGQPSTHDVPLALSVFSSLRANKPTAIPQYNKAAFNGQGDRNPKSEWQVVNKDPEHLIKAILFEGWSVGFRPLSPSTLSSLRADAVSHLETSPSTYNGRLAHNTLESITDINEALRSYDAITDQFDAFIHIDAADPQYVYKWRSEQEKRLRESKGSGMTDEQVEHFVDGYYPAYELYTETLREGVFGSEQKGRQLRLVVGQDRKVREVMKI